MMQVWTGWPHGSYYHEILITSSHDPASFSLPEDQQQRESDSKIR